MATNTNGKNFRNLQGFIAKAEHAWSASSNPKDFIKSGNLFGSGTSNADYHLGYFQLSGRHIRTICNYINNTGYTANIEQWYSSLMQAVFNDLKNKSFNLACGSFPDFFDYDVQSFFHAIFVAQSLFPIRAKALVNGHHYTLADVVLYNLTGHFGINDKEPWDGNTLFHIIHPTGDLSPYLYIWNSGCLGDKAEQIHSRVKYHTTTKLPYLSDSDLSEVFSEAVYRDDSPSMVEDCKIEALKHWNASPILKKLIPSTAAVEDLFTNDALKIFTTFADLNYTAPLAQAPGKSLQPPPANWSNATPMPFLTDVIAYYDRLKKSPAIYRQGLGAEEKGLLFIGDLLFSIPPVAMRFSEANQAVSIPAMRTEGDPVISSNNTIPRVELTLYFNGDAAINGQLRPLVAMFQSMPFTTIQNTSIWDAWVGRREELSEASSGAPIHRFYPMTCYLENISLSTIPGFPNTVQAHISLSQMDRTPYGASALMWVDPVDAFIQAKMNTIRHALDNTIVDARPDATDKTKDVIKILDSADQLFSYTIPDNASKGNSVMDPTLTTPYPQESVPFKYMYRERLAEHPVMEFTDDDVNKTNVKDPLTHWPKYQAEHNKKLYLSYKAPKSFSSPTSVFKKRLLDATEGYRRVQSMLAIIDNLSDEQFTQFYKDVKDITWEKIVKSWLGALSSVKSIRSSVDGINQLTMEFIATMLSNEDLYKEHLVSKTSEKIVFNDFSGNEVELYISPINNEIFKYVNSNMEIVESWDAFLLWIGGLTGSNGWCSDSLTYVSQDSCEDSGATWTTPSPSELVTVGGIEMTWKERGLKQIESMLKPFVESFQNMDEKLHLDSVETTLNYESVGVELSWLTDTDLLSRYDTDINILVEKNKHKEKTNDNAFNTPFYQFQSVVQSITYNFANNVVPVFTASSNKPTFQHTGIPNSTATIVFKTRDERLHKVIRDMQQSTQEVGFQLLSGNFRLAGTGTVDITGKLLAHSSDRVSSQDGEIIMGEGRGPLSGNLLNSLGFSQSVIQNLSSRTIEGHPGWWEVTLDLIQDTQNVRILEYLAPTLHSSVPHLMSILEYLFPFYLVDWTALDQKLVEDETLLKAAEEWFKAQAQYDAQIETLEAAGDVHKIEAIKRALGEKVDGLSSFVCKDPDGLTLDFSIEAECNEAGGQFHATASTYTWLGALIIASSNIPTTQMRHAAYQTLEAQNIASDAKHAVRLKDAVGLAMQSSLSLDKKKNETLNVLVIPGLVPDFVIKLNTSNDEKEKTINAIFKPMKDAITALLQDMSAWETDQRRNPVFDTKFPKEYGLTAAMSAYYRDFLELLVRTTANLATQNPTLFLEWDKRSMIFPTSLENEYAALNLSKTEIFLETMVMLSNTKHAFYTLAKRADFREWLSSISVKTNHAYILRGEQLKTASTNLGILKDTINSSLVKKTIKKEFILNIERRTATIDRFITNLENSPVFKDNKPLPTGAAIKDFVNKMNLHIKSNYPDLRLPDASLPETGHRLIGPGFPFVDDDLDLEIIEMSRLIDNIKLVTYAQFTAIATGDFGEYWELMLAEFKKSSEMRSIAQMILDKNMETSEISESLLPDYLSSGYCSESGNNTKAECQAAEGTWKSKLDVNVIWNSFSTTNARLEKIKLQTSIAKGSKDVSSPRIVAPSKQSLIKLMTTTAMLDYLSSLLFAAAWLEHQTVSTDGGDVEKELQAAAQNMFNQLQKMDSNSKEYAKVLEKSIMFQWQSFDESDGQGIKISNETRELGSVIANYLADKRKNAAAVATIAATGDYQAFLNYFGIGDVTSVKKSYLLKSKFNNYLQNKRKGTMDRAFPTFKIFFIEEDNSVWHAFDDLYTYDAASEITIVESKHAASKTAILKLSNVTQALTNEHAVGEMLNESAAMLPGEALRIKAGTELMIFVGYGSDYRNLRMKFKGAITELVPGPILEITAQSWGAGLLNNVGSTGGTKYSALSGAATMGAAVIDILAKTPGLRHLGRWEIRKQTLSDVQRTSESALKGVYYARALNSIMGWATDFLPVSTNITDVIGKFTGEGLPTTGQNLLRQFRENNVLISNIGNSLYDNIIINNTNPKGYGFWNLGTRLVDKVLSPRDGGFNWTVVRQTGWDALHEIALFMGDYIVTTLPFNEGNDLFSQAPRETLYFGPREGVYKAKSHIPTPSINHKLDELKDIIAQITGLEEERFSLFTKDPHDQISKLDPDDVDLYHELTEQQDEKVDTILSFGKALLAPLIEFAATRYPTVSAANQNSAVIDLRSQDIDAFDSWKNMEQGTESLTMQQSLRNKWGRLRGGQKAQDFNLDDGILGLGKKAPPSNSSTQDYMASTGGTEDFLSVFDQLLDLNGFEKTKRWLREHTYLIFDEHADDLDAVDKWDLNRDEILSKFEARGGPGYGNQEIIELLSIRHPDIVWTKDVDLYTDTEQDLYRAEARQYAVNHGTATSKPSRAYVERIINRADVSASALHELLLDDFAHKHMPKSLGDSYNYHEGDWDLIQYLKAREGERGPMEENLDQKNYLENNTDFVYNGMALVDEKEGSTDYIWNMGFGKTNFEYEHYWDEEKPYKSGLLIALMPGINEDSGAYISGGTALPLTRSTPNNNRRAFNNIISEWFAPVTLGASAKTYSRCESLIYFDTIKLITDYTQVVEKQASRSASERYEPYMIDFEQAIMELGGLTDIFAYKPVVQQHAVNSYEDILDNSIIVSHDQMYNHVELLYPSEPDGADDPNNAVYRHQAYISMDQDLDYLRTYQVYMKNLDPNVFFDLNDAQAYMASLKKSDTYWGEDTAKVKRSFLLKQHQVAQAILLNVIKPMYQGTLTMLGNPNIRPWDIVHVHDDSVRMYGPVEVEQVVTSISATGGYTTTIIPNLLVYFKNSSTMLDGLIMDLFRTVGSMQVWGNTIKHLSMWYLGIRFLGLKTGLGKSGWLFKSSIGAKYAKHYAAAAEGVENMEQVTQENWKAKKDIARKSLTKEEFTELNDIMTTKNSGEAIEQRARMISKDINFGTKTVEQIREYATLQARVNYLIDEQKLLESTLRAAHPAANNPLVGETADHLELRRIKDLIVDERQNLVDKADEIALKKGSLKNSIKSAKIITETRLGGTTNRAIFAADQFDDLISQVDDVLAEVDPKANASIKHFQGKVDDLARWGADLEILEAKRMKYIEQAKHAGKEYAKLYDTLIAGYDSNIKDITKTIDDRIAFLDENLIKKRIHGAGKTGSITEIIEKSLVKTRKSAIDDIAGALTSRSLWSKGLARTLNWAGWLYTFYEIGDYVWDGFIAKSKNHVYQAGLIAGENFLTPVFLEYQGKPYIAGFEGILGSPRGISTILHGQLLGDGQNNNRTMLVAEMAIQQDADLQSQ